MAFSDRSFSIWVRFLYSLRIFRNTLLKSMQLVAFDIGIQCSPTHVMRMRTMERIHINDGNNATIERNQIEFHINEISTP